jgi:hypothetical protein
MMLCVLAHPEPIDLFSTLHLSAVRKVQLGESTELSVMSKDLEIQLKMLQISCL